MIQKKSVFVILIAVASERGHYTEGR